MVIVSALLEFDLPYVHSLKGRRAFLNSIKERLKKFNISLLDLSGEYAKEASLSFVFLSHSEPMALSYLQEIEKALERFAHEAEFTLQYDFI
jgi:uncharacterized protein YlxP (DUF503 family)